LNICQTFTAHNNNTGVSIQNKIGEVLIASLEKAFLERVMQIEVSGRTMSMVKVKKTDTISIADEMLDLTLCNVLNLHIYAT